VFCEHFWITTSGFFRPGVGLLHDEIRPHPVLGRLPVMDNRPARNGSRHCCLPRTRKSYWAASELEGFKRS
jgi:hypothetical protein